MHDDLVLTTGFSVQMRNLITYMASQGVEWSTVSQQFRKGEVRKIGDFCTEYPSGWNDEEKYAENLPQVIDIVKPDVGFGLFDVQDMARWKKNMGSLPMAYWLPKDNEENIPDEFKAINSVDQAIAMSQFSREFFLKHNVDIPRVYHSVDCTAFRPLPEPALNELYANQTFDINKQVPPDYTLLLYVGRLGWRKNIELLFGATRELINRGRKVILYMHTDMNDVGGDLNPRKLTHAFGLWNNTIVTGGQSMAPEKLNLIYNRADIYVSTHAGEGFGVPMAEAMACGKPVVATDYTTTKEFVGEYERGIAVPYERVLMDHGVYRPLVDINKFATAVEYLIDNPSERARMGSNGVEFAKREFDIPVVGRAMLDILSDFTTNECSV